jgi:hypothetical protein
MHRQAGSQIHPEGVLGRAVLDDLAVSSLTRSLFAPRGPRQKSTVAYICDGTRSWGARFLCRPASGQDDATVAGMATLQRKKPEVCAGACERPKSGVVSC